MIASLHRPAWVGPPAAAPLFDDERPLVDRGSIEPLFGAVPTWRPLDEDPLYLAVVAALGVPALDEADVPPGGDVVAGEVLPPTAAMDLAHLFDDSVVHDAPTAPIALLPTTAIPVTGRGGRWRRAPKRVPA